MPCQAAGCLDCIRTDAVVGPARCGSPQPFPKNNGRGQLRVEAAEGEETRTDGNKPRNEVRGDWSAGRGTETATEACELGRPKGTD